MAWRAPSLWPPSPAAPASEKRDTAYDRAACTSEHRRCVRAVWYRVWGAVAPLFGTAMTLAASLALASVPDLMEDERRFRAAKPCWAAAVDGCLHTVLVTLRHGGGRAGTRLYAFIVFNVVFQRRSQCSTVVSAVQAVPHPGREAGGQGGQGGQ